MANTGLAAELGAATNLLRLVNSQLSAGATRARPVLRDYQREAVDGVFEQLAQGRRSPTVVLATGGGKTVIASEICLQLALQGKRGIFIVDREDLIDQTSRKFNDVGLVHSFIKAGRPEDRGAAIYVASWQSMGRRDWWRSVRWDFLIFDEAHGSSAWSKTGQLLISSDSIKIFLTATPWPGGRRLMSTISDSLVLAATPKDLMERGYLRAQTVYSLPQADLSGVGTVGGDWDEEELQVVCDRQELIEQAYRDWSRLASDRLTLVFCVRQQHARNVQQYFNTQGHRFALILGDESLLPDGSAAPRETIYSMARSGQVNGLVGVGVFTTGFDMPEVGCGLMLRPTKSASLYCQMMGRMQRPHPTDTRPAIILDQGGNCWSFGLPWLFPAEAFALEGKPPTRKKPGSAVGANLKTCPNCYHMTTPATMECPDCGYEWPIDDTGKIKQQNDLEEWAPIVIEGFPEFPDEWRSRVEELCLAAKAVKQKRQWVANRFLDEPYIAWDLKVIKDRSVLHYLAARLRFKKGWPYTYEKMIQEGKVGGSGAAQGRRNKEIFQAITSPASRLPYALRRVLGQHASINASDAKEITLGIDAGCPSVDRAYIVDRLGEIEEALHSLGYKQRLSVQQFSFAKMFELASASPSLAPAPEQKPPQKPPQKPVSILDLLEQIGQDSTSQDVPF